MRAHVSGVDANLKTSTSRGGENGGPMHVILPLMQDTNNIYVWQLIAKHVYMIAIAYVDICYVLMLLP